MGFELCFVCGEATGKAGRSEDSLYDEEDEGPYCEECFKQLTQQPRMED